jgi:hypothetical protein
MMWTQLVLTAAHELTSNGQPGLSRATCARPVRLQVAVSGGLRETQFAGS